MLQCIRKVRECVTLLTGRDQSHQCYQVLLATPTAPTRSAPVEFQSPSGLHASTRPAVIPSATSCCDFLFRPGRFVITLQGSYLPSVRHRFAANTILQQQTAIPTAFLLTTPHLESFTTLNDTCTDRSTRDLNVSFSRFVETDTTLDTVMHDLAHDLVHPDQQDEHKIRHCLRQISYARMGVSLLVFPQAQSVSAQSLSLAKAFPMLLLKMISLPRRFEKLVLHVAHAAGELCLQVHNHLLHLLGMRTLELLQVIPRRGLHSWISFAE